MFDSDDKCDECDVPETVYILVPVRSDGNDGSASVRRVAYTPLMSPKTDMWLEYRLTVRLSHMASDAMVRTLARAEVYLKTHASLSPAKQRVLLSHVEHVASHTRDRMAHSLSDATYHVERLGAWCRAANSLQEAAARAPRLAKLWQHYRNRAALERWWASPLWSLVCGCDVLVLGLASAADEPGSMQVTLLRHLLLTLATGPRVKMSNPETTVPRGSLELGWLLCCAWHLALVFLHDNRSETSSDRRPFGPWMCDMRQTYEHERLLFRHTSSKTNEDDSSWIGHLPWHGRTQGHASGISGPLVAEALQFPDECSAVGVVRGLLEKAVALLPRDPHAWAVVGHVVCALAPLLDDKDAHHVLCQKMRRALLLTFVRWRTVADAPPLSHYNLTWPCVLLDVAHPPIDLDWDSCPTVQANFVRAALQWAETHDYPRAAQRLRRRLLAAADFFFPQD